ncbi:MAG: amidohydrolase family protein [Planctomycetes bacterium]|nr:amidohydrolase family protein [Planctomycetota bacterium]
MNKILMTIMTVMLIAGVAVAEEKKVPKRVLFTNVKIFNGMDEKLINGNVLVENNLIKKISAKAIPVKRSANTTVIDGGGRTLMPGIIEAHGHPGNTLELSANMGGEDPFFQGASQVAGAKFFLDHGWTTVRDVGGPSYGIKKAIDKGIVPGPRIYPAGMMLSQTSGHGDLRRYADPHPDTLTQLPMMQQFTTHIADGIPEVLQATREELRKGAVHIKVMAGGGLASQFDPLHTTQYSLDELKAAVGAANDWGTYVMVHAYTDAAVNRAIDAGVKVIEHGQLVSEKTAKRMAEKGIWLSVQAILAAPSSGEAVKPLGEVTYNKWVKVRDGFADSIKFAKKYGIKMAFGTDTWGPAQPLMLKEFQARQPYFTNLEILRQATSINGELLQLTGPLNPYPEGPIGVIQEGAYADMIIVDGNPIDDLLLLENKDNIPVIIKDGKIYKNTL